MKNKGEDPGKKRLRGRKVTAYFVTNAIFIGMFLAILFKDSKILESTIIYFVGAILINTIAFVSINALDKFVNFKFFNKE